MILNQLIRPNRCSSCGNVDNGLYRFLAGNLFSPFSPDFSSDFFQMLYGRTVVSVPDLCSIRQCPQKKQTEVCFLLTMRSTTYPCLKNRSSTLSCVLDKTYCRQSGPKPVLIDSGCVSGNEQRKHFPSCNNDTFLSRRI